MTLISLPACVNSTIRRSTAAIQSMFSVPLSMAIFAPADSANHSTGTPSRSARSSAAMIRRHSGSASEPSARVGSPRMRDALHALRVALGRIADQSDDDAGGVVCKRPVDRHEAAAVVEVVLGEGPVRGGQQPGDLGRVHEAAPAGGDDAPRALVEGLRGRSGGSSTSTTISLPAGAEKRRTCGRTLPSGARMRTLMSTVSSPRPVAMGA